jgi:hypothetical protein
MSEPAHPGSVMKLAGKNVVKVYLLDNSMKTLLVDDDATAAVCHSNIVHVFVLALGCSRVRVFCFFLPLPFLSLIAALRLRCLSQDVVREMAEKIGIRNVAAVAPCLSLHECVDNVTSACAVTRYLLLCCAGHRSRAYMILLDAPQLRPPYLMLYLSSR